MKHIIKANLKVIKELSMHQDEWLEDAKKACEYFDKEIKHLFPKAHIVRAKLDSNLGYSIHFQYIGDEFQVTRHNAKELIEFMMHLGTSSSVYKPDEKEQTKFDIEFLMRSYQYKEKGLKPRKISGKSPMDATKKLVDWFKKNKDIIKSAETAKVKIVAGIDQTSLKHVIANTNDSDYELVHTYTYDALNACCEIVRRNSGLPMNDMPKAYKPKTENGKIYFGSKKSMIPFFYALEEGKDKFSLYELSMKAYTRLGF